MESFNLPAGGNRRTGQVGSASPEVIARSIGGLMLKNGG
jgi:hypothetical protein